ncbi:MAG: carboxypeptidase-like regulatory domain-containing protein, partial [Prevotella sp.]
MNVSQESQDFRHGRAMVKATTCLLLLAAGSVISPVQAAQEGMGITSTTAVQQNGVVKKGIIVDDNGEPIIGASVVEKDNPKNGTVTDFNGNYSLKVKNSKSQLVASYIGFVTQVFNGGSITLLEDLKSLNEVVVIGYGTQRKGDITSAVSSVKAE